MNIDTVYDFQELCSVYVWLVLRLYQVSKDVFIDVPFLCKLSKVRIGLLFSKELYHETVM